MSVDVTDCTPTVYFYIGTNDSDEEDEGFGNDCESFSASCIPLFTQVWNDISTWEKENNPPLETAIKILRILQGLKMTPREHKQNIASYNGHLNRRVATVSAAMQEYKELLCAKVFSILEEKGAHDLSELKDEIRKMKKQIQHAKLSSHQNEKSVRKKRSLLRNIKEALVGSPQLRTYLNLETETHHTIISEQKPLDQRASSGEDDDESTVKCSYFCKTICRK
ncbi:uncharacterized protein LOC142140272 isoform X2 [Mixophyes fleayi]|uniref:uncharacterized protein LOC142140272 isoform X2 n=1 Tax=Mixophyes fleayi TaxID=3061075 RepID=UPI003F4DE270